MSFHLYILAVTWRQMNPEMCLLSAEKEISKKSDFEQSALKLFYSFRNLFKEQLQNKQLLSA
jgi:hypothetical protein